MFFPQITQISADVRIVVRKTFAMNAFLQIMPQTTISVNQRNLRENKTF